jgi:uncharacterized protein (TIGR02453 family)
MSAHFSDAGLKFLRGLARHNDREWFEPRKPIYERELKAPMLALIEAINHQMLDFAPLHVRPPKKCMMRIYRDIRFASDKRPYKIHVAAWWARQGLEKTSGAGFYLDLSGTALTIAGGVYMPEKDQLVAIRRMLLDRHAEVRKLLGAKKLRTAGMIPIDAVKMVRGPKAFDPGHPAMDLILQRQWGASCTLPVEIALAPGLLNAVVSRFRLVAPLVHLLNAPLEMPSKKPLF